MTTQSDSHQTNTLTVETASTLLNELRATFASGETRSYKWRISQLKQLYKIAEHHEQEIVDALLSDVGKPPLETVAYEVRLSSSLNLFNLLFVNFGN